MAYPFFPPFKSRMYHVTSSSSVTSIVNVTIGARCKYLSTTFTPTSTAGGTSGVELFFWPNSGATAPWTAATAATVICSGFAISTTTGNQPTVYNSTGSFFLNAGDVLTAGGLTTGFAGVNGFSFTHYVQEF